MATNETTPERLNPQIYERIVSNIGRIARLKGSHTLTVDMVEWQNEAGLEDVSGTKPIGAYQEHGLPESNHWIRFTSFDDGTEYLRRRGFNDAFTVLTGQVDLKHVTEHAQLEARLRTVAHDTGSRVHHEYSFQRNGRLSIEESHAHLVFANTFGLYRWWKESQNSGPKYDFSNFLGTRRARPIATALSELTSVKT